MSDKSVRKVLDWPNHRVGSKPSDPVRFEEDKKATPSICPKCGGYLDIDTETMLMACPNCGYDEATDPHFLEEPTDEEKLVAGEGFEIMEDEECEVHQKTYGEHSLDELDEDVIDPDKVEQGDASTGEGWEGQAQGDPSQQLNPTTEQNVSPYTQSQFVPTGTQMTAPTGKGEQDSEGVFVEPCSMCDGLGRDDITGHRCGYCRGTGKVPKYEEEVKDPRIAEKAKEKGLEPESGLSPEAQKIAGTDPATQKAKDGMKPKLEVDVSDKVTTLGKTGSGKTNLIKVLLSDILKDYQFVLLDAIGNFAEYESNPNVEYHQTNPTDTAGVDEILYAALERGDCMVVIDEVDRYDTKKGTMLNELVNVGRNYNVGGIFAARRTADVDKDILANSKYIFTFQHILPQDLDVLIDWFAQPEQTFRDLQEYEAILFKDGDQVWVGKVPEKPTTKPTKKPVPPKKPKGKDKDKSKEPSEPKEKGPPTPSTGEGKEPTVGEGGKEPEVPPEEEPTEEPEAEKQELQDEVGSLKQDSYRGGWCERHQKYIDDHSTPELEEDVYGSYSIRKEEGAFKCEFDGQTFKYEKDYLNHLNTHAGR
jgi:hypothetical protein